MKPVIGVMPLWDEEKESLWMLPGYMNGIAHAGGIPIVFPLSSDEETLERLVAMCDGFLFTGGQDVSTELYNEESIDCVESCKMRDEMEAVVLKKAIDLDKPILGICRGIQFINVCLGGTLYQDLNIQHPSEVEHHQNPPYDIPVHEVKIEKDSPLFDCVGADKLSVNSYHHQAVKELSPQLSVMAVSEDGLVEAVYRKESRFLWALQWHPEFSYMRDENSAKIFDIFVRAAKK
ncbi:MAG: gamma-glutamyl-gamma-aminobutyrate hydrolase family protein [Eubacterium sp.]|nr:gamma-glutamyl-gamma-aminobutyrate hydrolase family protein [Eubacterium sp.]